MNRLEVFYKASKVAFCAVLILVMISGCSKGDNASSNKPIDKPLVDVQMPTVAVPEFSAIGLTSVVCNGTVTSTGGGTITSRGVCWSTSPSPDIKSNKAEAYSVSGSGAFMAKMENLYAATTYYVRAFAINAAGIAYSTDIVVTTSVPVAAIDPTKPDPNPAPSLEGYDLYWTDEFNTNGKPDATKWSFENGFVRNEELQ